MNDIKMRTDPVAIAHYRLALKRSFPDLPVDEWSDERVVSAVEAIMQQAVRIGRAAREMAEQAGKAFARFGDRLAAAIAEAEQIDASSPERTRAGSGPAEGGGPE